MVLILVRSTLSVIVVLEIILEIVFVSNRVTLVPSVFVLVDVVSVVIV